MEILKLCKSISMHSTAWKTGRPSQINDPCHSNSIKQITENQAVNRKIFKNKSFFASNSYTDFPCFNLIRPKLNNIKGPEGYTDFEKFLGEFQYNLDIKVNE